MSMLQTVCDSLVQYCKLFHTVKGFLIVPLDVILVHFYPPHIIVIYFPTVRCIVYPLVSSSCPHISKF